ncbi:hypothetical protein V5O48_018611, partial [Marasmius crinis-equi]
MRDTTSCHIESLHSPSNGWFTPYRTSLNLRDVVHLIPKDLNAGNDASVLEPENVEKGRKRSREGDSSDGSGSKRMKTSSGASLPKDATVHDENPYPAEMEYPTAAYLGGGGPKVPTGETVPVLHHVFEVQFTNDIRSDLRGHQEEWQAEEKWFVKELQKKLGNLVEPRVIELGNVWFSIHDSRVVVRSERILQNNVDESDWLALLPFYNPSDFDLRDLDFQEQRIEDLFLSIAIL